jgi:hypothetical protein
MKYLLRVASVLFSAVMVLAAAPQTDAIRKIDFRNFVYPWDDPGGSPSSWRWTAKPTETTVRVVRGGYSFFVSDPSAPDYSSNGGPAILFMSVTYGHLLGDGREEAAVTINYSTGGTSNWNYLYVFKLERGTPRLIARLQAGDRAYGGLFRVVIKDGLLVLDFLDPDRQQGLCCSAGYIRVRYRWEHGRFVETGQRERGDLKPEDQ